MSEADQSALHEAIRVLIAAGNVLTEAAVNHWDNRPMMSALEQWEQASRNAAKLLPSPSTR